MGLCTQGRVAGDRRGRGRDPPVWGRAPRLPRSRGSRSALPRGLSLQGGIKEQPVCWGTGRRPGGTPGSGQPHVPSFPAIPAKTKGEEAALPPARFVLARSAAAAGQPRSPPAAPPAAPPPPRLQEGWSRARCRSAEQTWATRMVLFPLQPCLRSPGSSPGDGQRWCRALGCPSLPPSLWELLSPALARGAGLLWGLEASSERCPGRVPLPWAPEQLPGLPSRLGRGRCAALGKRQTPRCRGKGP